VTGANGHKPSYDEMAESGHSTMLATNQAASLGLLLMAKLFGFALRMILPIWTISCYQRAVEIPNSHVQKPRKIASKGTHCSTSLHELAPVRPRCVCQRRLAKADEVIR